MRLRLRGQYATTIGGLIFLTTLVLSTALYEQHQLFSRELEMTATVAVSRAVQRQYEAHGLALARALADRITNNVYQGDLDAIAAGVADTRAYPQVTSVSVLDHVGKILSDGTDSNGRVGQQADHGWLRPIFKTHRPRFAETPSVLRIATPVVAGPVLLGVVVVETSRAVMLGHIKTEHADLLDTLHRARTRFVITGAAVSVVLMLCAAMVAITVAGGLAEPIQGLATRARLIGRGQRDATAGSHRHDELGDLARAFDEMAEALRRTTVSKDYVDNILQSMAEMLVVTDASQRIVTANRACLGELGCSEDAIRGLPIDRLLPELTAPLAARGDGAGTLPHDRTTDEGSLDGNGQRAANGHQTAYADKSGVTYFALTRLDGSTLPVQLSVASLLERNREPVGSVYVMQNVTEHLTAQEQSERSLREKEILLKEVHHRVKNNLQIVSSMLSMQAHRSLDDATRNIFLESENRIRAMALIHEQLYRSRDLARVDMLAYLENLSAQVVRSTGRQGCTVDVNVDASLRELAVDVAIPLGLIVNELLSNSVRHAFPDGRAGTVRVCLRTRGPLHELEVSDDGIGLPPGLDADSLPTLGLKLVSALVGQLRGSLEVTDTGNRPASGVTLRALFPAPADKPAAGAAAAAASPPATPQELPTDRGTHP